MDKKLKTLRKINLTLWIVITIFLVGFLLYTIVNANDKGGNFSLFNLTNSETTIQKDESISIDKCTNISLDFSSYNVIIYSTDDDNLRVVEKSNSNLSESEKFSYSKNDTTIAIEKGNSKRIINFFQIGSLDNELELYIPKNYNKNLDVTITSGNINIKNDLNLDKISLSQTSGNFECKQNTTANEINLKSTSGNIKASNLVSKSYKIKATSGNIDINNLSGSGEVNATSGNIKIDYTDLGEELNLNVTSGNVHLNIPKDINFDFYGKCTSGDIDTNFDLSYKTKNKNEVTGKIGTPPYKKINVTSSSGNLNIYQK